jgi:hypothetical protein
MMPRRLAVAVLAVVSVACPESPTAPEPPNNAPSTVAATEASTAEVAKPEFPVAASMPVPDNPPGLTAEFLDHGRVRVFNHFDKDAWGVVRYEKWEPTIAGWLDNETVQHVIHSNSYHEFAPRCWFYGDNRITIPGVGSRTQTSTERTYCPLLPPI